MELENKTKTAEKLYDALLKKLEELGRTKTDLRKNGKGTFLVGWRTLHDLSRGVQPLRPTTVKKLFKALNIEVELTEQYYFKTPPQ